MAPGKKPAKRKKDGDKGKQPRRWRCEVCMSADHPTIRCEKLVCFECDRQGHQAAQCPNKRCHFCGEEGHLRTECPARVNRMSVRERAGTSGSGSGVTTSPSRELANSESSESVELPASGR